LYRQHLSKIGLAIACLLPGIALIGKTSVGPQRIVITGRIVAQAENHAEDFGSGSFLGSSQHYVFQVEAPGDGPRLIKILYAFRNEGDKLPESYLDYSVVRKLAVVRDTLCDASLQDMAYTQGFDAQGHPVEHQFTLKMAKGAPAVQITRDKLPCYMLQPQGLKASPQ